MKKVGRKQSLSAEQVRVLRARLANYHRVRREDNPNAIAADLGVSVSAVYAYDKQVHKGDPGQSHEMGPSADASTLITVGPPGGSPRFHPRLL